MDGAVGVVETHGRQETEAFLRGLDQIPAGRSTTKALTIPGSRVDSVAIEIIDEGCGIPAEALHRVFT